jgi:hypothetical protein
MGHTMKKACMAVLFIAILVGGGLLWSKYDEWFIYPPLRAHVNDLMVDPASTQYRKEYMTKAGWLCGELNTKNEMGGYVGFKRFVSGSSDDAYLEDHWQVAPASGTKNSTAQIIVWMDKEREVRKRLSDTNDRRSELAIEKMVANELFDVQWDRICRQS